MRGKKSWPGFALFCGYAILTIAVAAVLVVAVAAPAWLLVLRPGQGWTQVPSYWHDAAQWLGRKDGSARTLMLPATGFGV